MKFGRSIATFTLRRRSGMPCRIVGKPDVSIVRCESAGSILIGARITTVPRPNGPARARMAITRLNRAPPEGRARWPGPESEKGAGPGPDDTVEVPTRLASGHAPAAA